MRYAKSYIDNYFNSINDYHSKSELFSIAYHELKERSTIPDWYVELREIMNWQSQSDRSGVWTYYEILDEDSSNIVLNKLKTKKGREILEKYVMGINKYSDEKIMEDIDKWIWENEDKIYQYLNDILISNKDWFYSI